MLSGDIHINYWWVGFLTYLPFHVLHIFVWRLRPPMHEVRELFLYLLLLPAALGLIGIGFAGSHATWLPALLPIALFHFLLAANYITIYPAFQASSPTIHILCLLAKRPEGLTKEELKEALARLTSMEDRVRDLKASRLMTVNARKIELSTAGRWIATFFVGYRKFLGLGQGAG